MRKTTCACGKPSRPKQRNCHECHAKAQSKTRSKHKREFARLRKIVSKVEAALK